MASRVNVKFVVILAIVLGGVCIGVAGAAYYVVLKSASALARQGDAAMAEGDYALAERLYSKAVNKEQSNVEYLQKWRDAMLHKVPETQTEFRTDYQMYVGGILKHLANIKRDDVDAYHDYLGEMLEGTMSYGFSRGAYERLIEQTDAALRQWAVYDDQNNLTETGVAQDDQWQTLRRYSGIALVRIMNERLPLKDHEIARAKADLEAALDANPEDAVAARFLALWHFNRAIDADKANDPALAAQRRQAGMAVLDRALEHLPGHPDLLLRKLAGRVDAAIKSAQIAADASKAEQDRAYREAVRELAPLLDRVEQAMLDAGAEQVDAGMVGTFERIASLIDRDDAADRAARLLRMLLDADPGDFEALLLKARLANERADHPTAVEALESIIELPRQPIGLEGRLLHRAKRVALFKLIETEAALASARGTEEGPDPEHLANAKAYRDRLAETLREDHPFLTFANAKIRVAEGDLNAAQRLLVDYNRATQDSDPEALMMAAEINERAGAPGKAKELYQQVIDLRPSHVPAMYRLAALHLTLEEYEEARDMLEQVLNYAPDHEKAREGLGLARAMLDVESSDDPVVSALVRAENLRLGRAGTPADPEAALGILDQAMDEHDDDPRLAHMAATTSLQLGRTDDALTYIEAGLRSDPGNQLLLRQKQRLQAADSLEATLAMIEEQGGSQIRVLLNKYRAAHQFDEPEMADQFLDRAAELDPTAPGVVEATFFRALRRGDMEEAERLARVAEEHDTDRANGLAFRAHLRLARDDVAGAADALERAVDLGTATASVWKLLGDARWRLGRRDDALDAYQEALRVNPNDLEAITGYVAALANAGRRQEALGVARDHHRFAGRSRRLMDLWLTLEGSIGDKQLAAERRSYIAQRNPDDRDNLIALASLHIDLGNWQRARTLLKELRSEQDSLRLVAMAARWHAEQGDLQAGIDEFRAHITSLPEDQRTSRPVIAMGRFLLNRGHDERGLEVLASARQYPNEEGFNADVVLADELMRRGRYEESLDAIASAFEQGYDDRDGYLRKRKAVALLNLGRLDEAEAVVEEMADMAEQDFELMLLRADVAAARGKTREMRDILDTTVARFNENPVAYYRRAQALKGDPRLLPDVLQDLDTAIQLDPGYTDARRLRAAIHFTQGREERALDDLRAAVTHNPHQDGLRTVLMRELLKRGRAAEAQNVAREAVEARPGDRALLIAMGDVFSGFDEWGRAAGFYQSAWRLQQDMPILERFAEALLRIGETEAVQQILDRSELDADDSPTVLLIRARLHAARGDLRTALQTAAQALDRTEPSRAAMQSWYEKVKAIFLPDRAADFIAYLGDLSQSRPDNPWLPYYAAETAAMAGRPDRALEALEALTRAGAAPVRFAALSLKADLLMRQQRYQEAARTMEAALEINPDDVTLNNNLAFLLAEELGRPEDALQYAQRAHEAAPNQVTVLDTLGATYQALGRLEEARDTLTEALRISLSDTDRATVLARLARIALDSGRRSVALERLDQLENLMDANPRIEEAHRDTHRELMEQLR